LPVVVAPVVGIKVLTMVSQGSLALLEAMALKVNIRAVQMVLVVVRMEMVLALVAV
jgi:hypothetical protein